MLVRSLLAKFKAPKPEIVTFSYNIKKVNVDKRLVTGQVYAPDCLDSHGHFMTADELEKVAHDYLHNGLQNSIDFMHNHELVDACVVESWIAHNHPDWEEGAWIATTKVNDDTMWSEVKAGNINGYSFEILTYKEDVPVEIEYKSWYYGYTDPHPIDKHVHAYLIKMDAEGNVFGGETSEAPDGHKHRIVSSNVTRKADGHSHRIHLERIS